MALYRLARFCIVSSLHDGMNLVAKEFVAARDDLDGVLILSEMAGAAAELHEALIINPVRRARLCRRRGAVAGDAVVGTPAPHAGVAAAGGRS